MSCVNERDCQFLSDSRVVRCRPAKLGHSATISAIAASDARGRLEGLGYPTRSPLRIDVRRQHDPRFVHRFVIGLLRARELTACLCRGRLPPLHHHRLSSLRLLACSIHRAFRRPRVSNPIESCPRRLGPHLDAGLAVALDDDLMPEVDELHRCRSMSSRDCRAAIRARADIRPSTRCQSSRQPA